MPSLHPKTIEAIRTYENDLLANWRAGLESTGAARGVGEELLHRETNQMLMLLVEASQNGDTSNIGSATWEKIRQFLEQVSRSRALQGFDSQHTATFVFSLKQALFALIQREFASDPLLLTEQVWMISELVDALGMHTVRTFQKSREDVIKRQQEELLELSTPVVKLWDGILALPMIGTLDSQRTQVVMESLLQKIVDTGSEVAIIDITGVPTVDTLVAQHLLKTVTAIRLMGADCIISGVRPQIAQTIVHLGLDLQGVITKSNLADALALALKRAGLRVVPAAD
ncbi:STAS domain-containing protein [Dyella sp.]|uniref:STAS domain-containing protein n=1 Tax=Dyella sp. TaxID=1869338 RepID=UPI002ED352FC